ncbi:hypothetical protein KJ708_12075, partial [bacterium]|nr:hypothetical protein [bacterium]MBU1917806.1 hypothetical protein [bacterium]
MSMIQQIAQAGIDHVIEANPLSVAKTALTNQASAWTRELSNQFQSLTSVVPKPSTLWQPSFDRLQQLDPQELVLLLEKLTAASNPVNRGTYNVAAVGCALPIVLLILIILGGCGYVHETPYDECDDVDGDGYVPAKEPEDCEGLVVEDYIQGYGDCDQETEEAEFSYPGAEEIPYDGYDQDCDGADLTDVDGDGFDSWEVDGEDCDDYAPNIHPDALEVCDDNQDNDCDDSVD